MRRPATSSLVRGVPIEAPTSAAPYGSAHAAICERTAPSRHPARPVWLSHWRAAAAAASSWSSPKKSVSRTRTVGTPLTPRSPAASVARCSSSFTEGVSASAPTFARSSPQLSATSSTVAATARSSPLRKARRNAARQNASPRPIAVACVATRMANR